jgi:hypothetical protein
MTAKAFSNTGENFEREMGNPYTFSKCGTDVFESMDRIFEDPCQKCPNNPKNGGSGTCNCTIPQMFGPFRVTY